MYQTKELMFDGILERLKYSLGNLPIEIIEASWKHGASLLWLGITIVCHVLELTCGAEFADVFLGGFGSDVETLGDGKICATVEFAGEKF